jgi:hypothetical protein
MIHFERAPSRDTTFRTSRRSGMWAVTKNNLFYGDYFSRDQAIRSACYGARTVEATGGVARVLAGEEIIAHCDPGFAPPHAPGKRPE